MSRLDRHRAVVGTAAGIGATVAMAPAANAADLTVTNTADSGPGSLRAVINTANLTPVTGDRILFQSGLSGTISPLTDLPALEGPTDIEGPGMDQLKIDSNGQHRIFQSYSETSISGLTLANGHVSNAGLGNGIEAEFSGGAIFVGGGELAVAETRIEGGSAQYGGGIAVKNADLTLSSSEVTGNQGTKGGGIAVGNGALTITDTEFSENNAFGSGGGVFVIADFEGGGFLPASIATSSFTDNSAFSGGGLQVYGSPTSIDSTLFSGNSATYVSGAMGLTTYPPTVISNTTITGNKAGRFGAGVVGLSVGGGITVESSTITGNSIFDPPDETFGGAGIIAGYGALNLNNSIVSGNLPSDVSTAPAPGIPGAVVPAGSIESSFSLIGASPGADLVESVPGSNVTSTDPGLGPLADNGGPTITMLPADDSPAVNKGSTTLPLDQRGLPRPVDSNSIPFSTAAGANGADIGAVEIQKGPKPSNNFSFGKAKLNRKKGVATLQVKVPGKGKVVLLGSKAVKKASRSAKSKSTLKLTVKAKGKALKKLKKTGKVKVKANVKFTPIGGTARTKSKTVKLAKKK